MAESSDNPILTRAHQQHRSGNLTEAAKSYRKYLKKNPNHAGALYLLGSLEYQRGRNGEATDLLLEAITLAPREPDYHNTLGLALTGLEKFDDAEQSFRRALQLENRGDFHLNLGLLRRRQNRPSEAVEHFRASLSLEPGSAELLCEIGDCLQETSNPVEASETYQQALNLEPELVRAWYSLGCAQIASGEFVPAAQSFQKAIQLQPDWLQARHNLARCLYETGQVTEACRHFAECNLPESRAMLAVIIPGDPAADHEAILAVRRRFVTTDFPPVQSAAARSPKDVLRIGYVSSFFQRDQWMKPVWGLINQHDRSQFLVNLFSDCPVSAIQHGYREHLSDRFFNTTSLNNTGLANLIKEAGIDILIDLNGFSNMRRLGLYTLRPAPVTIGWFNMYATSGMNCFDYLIGDEQVAPAAEERFYSEKILRVPGSYLTFSVDYPVPEIAPAPNLSGAITFGSLASQYKLTPEVIAAWSRILQAVPESPLLLKNKHLASVTTQNYLREQFASHGIPASRLILEGPADHFSFLKTYDCIDIALDPFPYNGGTTTTEALWQGVPVVCFHGDRWASRTSASLLHAAGLSEYIAADVESYISLAIRLAGAPQTLAERRLAMRSQLSESSVCDTATFARHMEALYLEC